MATRIRAILEAVDLATPTIRRVDRALTGLGVAAAAVGAYAIGRVLVQGIDASIKAASEAEAVNARLAQAIANSGQSVQDVLPVLQAHATALQRITAVDDEAIKSGQALLISLGKLRGEGLDKATQAALNFAKGAGKPLDATFTALAKAAAGSTGGLAKLGIVIDESVPKAERFEKVIAQLNTQFAGQAQQFAQTYAGQVEILRLNFEDLQETIGGPLIEVGKEFLRTFLNPLTQELIDSTTATATFRDQVFDLAIAFTGMLKPLEILATNANKMLALFVAFEKAKAGTGSLRELGEAGRDLAKGFELATPKADALQEALRRTKELGPVYGPIFDPLRDAADDVDDANRAVKDFLDSFLRAQRIGREVRSLSTLDPQTIEKSKQGFASFDLLINAAFRQMSQYAEKVIETLKTIETVSLDQAIGAFVDMGFVKMEESLARSNAQIESFEDTMNRTLRGAGVNAAEAFGNSLVDAIESGKFAFKDFARATFDMFARMITQALVWRAVLGISGAFAGGGATAWQSSAGAGLAAPVTSPVGAMSGPIIVNAPLTVAAGVNRTELAGILVEHRQNTMRAVADGVRRGGRYRAAFAS